MVLPLKKTIIYGPVNSRRLKTSLGINLMPTSYKLCSFDCIYCHYGWTKRKVKEVKDLLDLPSKETVKAELEKALKEIALSGKNLDHITFSGNGEPSLHPKFDEIVEIAGKLKEKYFPDSFLTILSNSSTFNNFRVKKALKLLDKRIAKLDAATEEKFKAINRPAEGISFQENVKGMMENENIIIQTVLIDGEISNVLEKDIQSYIELIKKIKPIEVQIYSSERPSPFEKISKIPFSILKDLAERIEKETRIKTVPYSY